MKTKKLENGTVLEVGKMYKLPDWERSFEIVTKLNEKYWLDGSGFKRVYEKDWQPYEEEQPQIEAINSSRLPEFRLTPPPPEIPKAPKTPPFKQPQPKYGDTVWVRNSEEAGWEKTIFIDLIDNGFNCRCVSKNTIIYFKKEQSFDVICWRQYRLTDPALDKETLTMTTEEALKELARLKGVDSINLKD